jgi:hypothetical protein
VFARLSVVICSHNPRPAYLVRVLDALRTQSLPFENWELLLIDNASKDGLASQFDIGWHPRGRHVREEQIGLTAARVRGIRESFGDIIVFVDDDNLLAPDYLEQTLRISESWPALGAWGGQCIPEFEQRPAEWTRRYWNWIALCEVDRDRWSNLATDTAAMPYGAGMCVRRCVANHYQLKLGRDPNRPTLDRTGDLLIAGGDTDMCLSSCDLGLGNGQFTALTLTHLIPAGRLEESYLLRLVESMTYSSALLRYFLGIRPSRPSRAQRLLKWYESLFVPERDRRFDKAREHGLASACREVERLEARYAAGPPTVSTSASRTQN